MPNESNIRVHIATQQLVLAEALAEALSPSFDLNVTNISCTAEACTQALMHPCDVLLLDLALPYTWPDNVEGLQLPTRFCKKIKAAHPQLKVIVLSGYKHALTLLHTYNLRRDATDKFTTADDGVTQRNRVISGYVLKTSSFVELKDCINYVMDNANAHEVFLCTKSEDIKEHHQTDPTFWLTVRQQRLLKLIIDDKTNEEIMNQMGFSPSTLHSNRKALLAKFRDISHHKAETFRAIDMIKVAAQLGLIWREAY